MKARNISFAEVLKGKARSPRLETKQATLTLQQLLQQWQLDPHQDYTLYLSNFKNAYKSKSSANMFTSRNPTNEDEEMFDSWIQRQSTLNANKENVISQPRKYQNYQSHKPSQQQQPPRFAFNSKGNSKGSDGHRAKTLVPEVQHRQTARPPYPQEHQIPRVNMSHLQNIGGNIQMIKSNTCEKQDLRRVRSPRRDTEEINLDVQEVDSYQVDQGGHGRQIQPHQIQEQKRTRQYQTKDNQRAQIQVRSFRQQQEFQSRQSNQPYTSDKSQNHKEQISVMIRQTSNIHHEIGDLAKKYAFEDELLQSKQSESQAQEEDDQLLIGNSDRKLFASETPDDQLFGNEYTQKARKEEEIQRQRREEAKMKLNDLMKQYYSKGKSPGFNLQREREVYPVEGIRVEQANSGVGYSFASNALNSECQNAQNQLKINNIQEINSQVPSIVPQMQQIDDVNFRKKYVKEQVSEIQIQPIQNIQSVQFDTYRSVQQSLHLQPIVPNQSFETKFIQAQNRSNYSSPYDNVINKFKESIEKAQIAAPSSITYPTYTTQNIIPSPATIPTPTPIPTLTTLPAQYGIKVSLNQKRSDTDNELSLNSFSREQDKGVNQKIKLVSNQKLKVYSNSNKSSPAASNSSQERQQKLIGVDVKTKPFVIGGDLHSITANDKPEPVRKQPKQTEDRCPSPFKSIKEVKESVISCGKTPSPEINKEERITTPTTSNYQMNKTLAIVSQKSKESPSYALPSNSNTYQPHSNNHAYTGNNYQTNYLESNVQPFNSSLVPSYSNAAKYFIQTSTYETKETYWTEINSYGNFTKTEYRKTQTEVIRDANPTLKKSEQEYTYSKYALPSYQPKRESDTRRSYLAELQLKQSINVEEPNMLENRAGAKDYKVGSNSRQNKGILDGHLKQSLKQSIQLRTSSEFNFDF